MARSDEVTIALDTLDTATSQLAARVQHIIDEINATAGEGLNGLQTEAVLTRLASIKGSLDAMGHTATTPFPTLPPESPPIS